MGCTGSSEPKKDSKVAPKKEKAALDNNNSLGQLQSVSDDGGSTYKNRYNQDGDQTINRRKQTTNEEEKTIQEIEIDDVRELEGHSNYIDVCSWNPKRDLLVTAATDRLVYLWYLGEGKAVQKQPLQVPGTESVSCVHWAEDGSLLAMGTEQGRVMLWSASGSLLTSWQPSDGIRSVKINGDLVVSAGNLICVYSIKNQTCHLSAWNPSPAIDAEWMSENKFLIAEASGTISLDSVSHDKMRKLEDYENDELYNVSAPKKQYVSHTGGVYKVLKNPHRSSTFATCSVDFTVKIWSIDEKKPKQTLSGHFGYVVDIAWVDYDTILSGSYDGSVKVWNTSSGEIIHSLEHHRDHVCSVGVSNNGLYAVSAGHDGNVNLWSIFGGRLANTFEGPGRILYTGFSKSGNRLVATSYGKVSILDISYHEIEGLSNAKPEEKKKSKKSKH